MAYKRSALMEERLAGARERILLATRRLVAAGGYRNAPVTAVAAEAGVSTGLIYRHFPSKAELFVEVLTDAVEHELRIFEAIAAEPLPAPERLRRAITAFVRRALAGPGLAYAFIAEQAAAADALDTDVAAACIVGAFTEALVGPTAPSRDAHGDQTALVESICVFCLRAAGAPQV